MALIRQVIGKVGALQLVLFFQILGFALFIFWLLLIARFVVEFIRSFSRDWHPTGITVVVLEIIMSITDPPVKLLRRLIPQLTIGAVRFDLSIMVLLLVAFIGMQLAFGAAACPVLIRSWSGLSRAAPFSGGDVGPDSGPETVRPRFSVGLVPPI